MMVGRAQWKRILKMAGFVSVRDGYGQWTVEEEICGVN